MVKKFKNSSDNHPYYTKKSVYLFALLAVFFIIEMVSLIYHSGVSASSNEQVAKYREQAISECDKSSVTPGDIVDRNGTVLLQYTRPITKDSGTYIDSTAYSTVLG
jgi:cell division protein FtsI/penicillin-binding protein 2